MKLGTKLGHLELSHGWHPLITAMPKSKRTRDATDRRPNSERTRGWRPLMTISQYARDAQGRTTMYMVRSPTWTSGHSRHFNSKPRRTCEHQTAQTIPQVTTNVTATVTGTRGPLPMTLRHASHPAS